MVNIYVLKLENNKYYIGKTNNPKFRIENHFNSNGSQWTKLYKPLELIELITNCDDYDEDKYTRIYMDKYGINNVRGGSFTSIELSNETIEILQKMNLGTNDKCFNCGLLGHFANKCNIYESDNDNYIYCCEYCNEEFENEKLCIKHEIKCRKIICYRCGRNGHYASSCYASKHIKGYYLK
jgi:hypothetical protein